MDKQQARLLLQSCRPDRRDADDPQFAEAWRVVAGDPLMAGKLADERASDLILAAQLKEFPIPAFGPARLLADIESRRTAGRRRRALTFALAASLLLLLSIVGAQIMRNRSAMSFANYRHEMLSRLDARLQLSFTSENPAELQNWLQTRRGLDGVVIPAGLRSLPGIGCRSWTWNGRPAGLICFLVDGREAVHLIVLPSGTAPHAPPAGTRQFEQLGAWQTASWQQDGNVYLLAGKLDRATLEKLL